MGSRETRFYLLYPIQQNPTWVRKGGAVSKNSTTEGTQELRPRVVFPMPIVGLDRAHRHSDVLSPRQDM
jgi:hypothetical protein